MHEFAWTEACPLCNRGHGMRTVNKKVDIHVYAKFIKEDVGSVQGKLFLPQLLHCKHIKTYVHV